MSSFLLRLLALVCMAADHTGLALFPSVGAFRCIGRLAFPLYCFLLVQGYGHTRDLRAYARRLLLLALLSEVPFDLLIFGRPACFAEQNALFSLLLGLLALSLADALRARPGPCLLAQAAVLLAAMASRVSYGWLGPALCLCFHFLRGSRLRQAACACVLLLVYTLSLLLSGVERGWALISLFALLAPPLLLLYNGRRGPRVPLLTALFYAAYPLHLLALCAVRALRLVPPYFF